MVRVPADVAVDFGTSGTLEEWIANIDTLYNREGAEPFQFALCHSMGSVLIELFGSSNWHGLPLAFTGHGGTGKSTACKIACGFYGLPKIMERQTGDQGSTLNAMIKRIAFMGSVPMLLDEFSGRTPEELTRTGYALANGRDKERLGSGGNFSTVGGEWFKNSFITSNDSIHESISKLPAGYKVEATQLRIFEVPMSKGYRNEVFSDITQSFIEHHMDNVYGHACRPFIRFIIKHHEWVRRQIVAARDKLNPKSDEDNRERFYRDTIVTAWVAGKIAAKLGLISFDVGNMKRWAESHVLSMRENRRNTNIDVGEHVAAYIASLRGRLIITQRMGDGRAKKQVEAPLEPIRDTVVGRIAMTDKEAYVTVSSMREYCKEAGLSLSELRGEMERTGLLRSDKTMRLTNGTTEISEPCRCVGLDYDRLLGTTPLKVVKTDDGAKTEVEENTK